MSHRSSDQEQISLIGDFLRAIVRFTTQHPRATLWLVLLSACACVALTRTYMVFRTKRSDLIDRRAEFHQRWLSYTDRFGDESDIVVVVEHSDPQVLKTMLNSLGSNLKKDTQRFSKVFYRIEPKTSSMQKGLQFASKRHLENGLRQLQYRISLENNGGEYASLGEIANRLSRDLNSNDSTPLAANRHHDAVEHTDYLATSLLNFLKDPQQYRPPWPSLLPELSSRFQPIPHEGYLLNDAEQIGLILLRPIVTDDGFEGAASVVDSLRQATVQFEKQNPESKITLTGIPVLESDEMQRSQSDMIRASLISFTGVGLLLMIGFRGLRHPLLALLMLTIAMAWTFGYTTLVIGHLNILSVSFAVILTGLGIDFAIHFLARYLELRHGDVPLRSALLKTSTGVGVGIVTAAITTAFAFFCASFTEFLGIAELGVIAGGGIILCAVATFLVLPALVSLSDRKVEHKKLPFPMEGKIHRWLTERYSVAIFTAGLLLVAVVGSQVVQYENGRLSWKIQYDSNLLNLQADGLESVEIQNKLFDEFDNSILYAVSVADSAAESRVLAKRYRELSTVKQVEELGSLLPAQPIAETKTAIKAWENLLAGFQGYRTSAVALHPQNFGKNMEELLIATSKIDDPKTRSILQALDEFLDRFERLSSEHQESFLRGYYSRTVRDANRSLLTFKNSTSTVPFTLDDLPVPLRERFLSANDKWLVKVYPKSEIWDSEPLEEFVAALRTVDSEVTGTPVQNFEASRQIMESYKTAALYAFAIICVILLLDFLERDYALLMLLSPLAFTAFTAMILKTRQIELNYTLLITTYVAMAIAIASIFDFRNFRNAMLAMVPPVGGGVLMFGLLGILKIDLNPANMIIFPLVLGIGVDDGVHVVHDFRMQKGKYRMSPSTINAIVLTSLTTIVGFGSLMLAAHRGLQSVGLVLAIGVSSCLFVALVLLPAILTMISNQQHGSQSEEGIEIEQSTKREKRVEREKKVA